MTSKRHVRLLQSAAVAALVASAAPALAQTAADSASSAQVSEVVVTASKRAENIMNVAAPVSAVTGVQLQRENANSLEDYITRLPGVVFNDYQPGVSEVVIRGIAATTYHEQGQTTVGYYLNEVNIVEPGFPIGIPDIDTFDLNRVEVLRGPQGTLFGASTLGGSVNYVVNTADAHKLDAAAEGLVGGTENAGEANYAGKAMINIPLIEDKLAIRLVALQRFDAGYLDNVGVTPEDKGSNDFRTRDLRASVVWEPTTGTKLSYLGAYQDTKLDDQTYITTAGDYIRSTGDLEPQRTSFFLNSLRLDQNLGTIGTLTVIGSIDEKTNYTVFTDPYGYVTGATSGPNVAYDYTHANANIKTIEARVASNDDGGPLRWLIGVSDEYTTKYSFDQLFAPGAEAYIAANPGDFAYPSSVLAPSDRIYAYLSKTTNEDFGLFGEATYRFNPLFDVTFGGRFYYTDAAGNVTNYAGYLSGSPVNLSGHVDQKETGFTPKVTLALHPSHNVLTYFTYSKGYRVGGINPNAGLLASIPTAYQSDTVDNIEGGVKATLLGGRLVLDETLFDEIWNNIQARLFGPAPEYYSYVTNASAANSAGSEFAGTFRITPQLTYGTSITYEYAHLTKFLADTFAVGGGYPSGTILPGSSRWSISNNVSYIFSDVWGKPELDLAHRYLDKAPVAFGNPNYRGNFNIFDARIGVDMGHNTRLLGFVDNMFNKYGILNAPFTAQAAPAYSIIRPRTYGLRVDWKL